MLKKYGKIVRMIVMFFCITLLFTVKMNAVEDTVYVSEEQAKIAIQQEMSIEDVQVGTYPFKVRYRNEEGAEIEKTFMITVRGDNTVAFDDELMDAENIEISSMEAFSFTSADWIEQSKASSWNKKTGEKIPIVSVNTSKIKLEQGQYVISFANANGREISTNVTITEKKGDSTKDPNANILNLIVPWHNLQGVKGITLTLIGIVFIISPLVIMLYQYRVVLTLTQKIKHLFEDEEE